MTKENKALAAKLREQADGIVTDIKAYGIPENNLNTKIINDKLRGQAKLLYDAAAALESSPDDETRLKELEAKHQLTCSDCGPLDTPKTFMAHVYALRGTTAETEIVEVDQAAKQIARLLKEQGA